MCNTPPSSCLDPISAEFSLLVAFKSLTNLSQSLDSFNVISVYDSTGEQQLALQVYQDTVALTVTVLQGPEAKPKRVTIKFDVPLNDRKWHRLAFSYEVLCLFVLYFCFVFYCQFWHVNRVKVTLLVNLSNSIAKQFNIKQVQTIILIIDQ